MATYEGKVKLGTLRYNGAPVPRPTRPWVSDRNPSVYISAGNIPLLSSAGSSSVEMAKWVIGNTDANEENQLYWNKFTDGNTTLWICDRVILSNTSSYLLHERGLITGTPVVIDGKTYTLRLMTGGMTTGDADKDTNEWGKYVLNKGNIVGLTSPSAYDLTVLDAADVKLRQMDAAHNQLWNWVYMGSFVQELETQTSTRRTRGYDKANSIATAMDSSRIGNVGWRPVLEIVNNPPVLSLTSPTASQFVSDVAGKRTITISGTVKDDDNQAVTVIATINGKTKTTTVTGTSVTKAWSLTWDVVSDAIPQGVYSNIVVTADDGNGSSVTAIYTGTITVDKTAPVITITGVMEGATYQGSVSPVFSATDAGGAGIDKVTATLNGAAYTSGTVISTSGAKTLIVTAVDKAGNQSQRTVNFILNKLPTLTLTSPPDNQTLTDGIILAVQGSAADVDSGNVVTAKYKINNGTAKALQSGVSNGSTPIPFAKNLTFRAKRLWDGAVDVVGADLAENFDHTLEVWSEDDQGGKSAVVTRKFRVIWNRPPVISDSNRDLGIIEVAPTVNYDVTDPENNPFTVTEKLNGVVVRSFAGVSGRQETFQISHDAWLKLEPGVPHTLTIEAVDDQGAKSTRTYTLKRLENQISFEIETPWTTDVAAKRVLLTMDMSLPPGAVFVAEATNNAFDTEPVWEDISFNARYGRGYVFQNAQKTATKWGVSIRVHIEKGTATDPITVKGFGGAFD